MTDKPNLENLPVELKVQIIEFAHEVSKVEREELNRSKLSRATRDWQYINGRPRHFYSALHDQEPILNCLQSLAVVNRSFYKLCRPLLWETLKFPTSLPVHIHTWTEGILPRHGQIVKSLSMELSDHFLMNPLEISVSTLYDNVMRCPNGCDVPKKEKNYEGLKVSKLGPVSVIQILDQCPNLDTLTIRLPDYDEPYAEEECTTLERVLIPCLRRLKKLKHLNLTMLSDFFREEEVSARLISGLPSLESFSFSSHTSEYPIEIPTFAVSGQMTNPFGSQKTMALTVDLSRIMEPDDLDWAHAYFMHFDRSLPRSWSHKLTELKMLLFDHFLIADIQRFVNVFGSTLTTFQLGTLFDPFTDIRNSRLNLDTNKFNLPELTRLLLFTEKSSNLLRLFKHCDKLEFFYYGLLHASQWISAQQLVRDLTWPQLTRVGLLRRADFKEQLEPTDLDLLATKDSNFKKFCLRSGIKATLTDFVPE